MLSDQGFNLFDEVVTKRLLTSAASGSAGGGLIVTPLDRGAVMNPPSKLALAAALRKMLNQKVIGN